MSKKEYYYEKEIFSGEELKKLLKDCDENVIFCQDTGDFEYFKGYTILSLDMTIRDLININKEKKMFNDMQFYSKEEFIKKQNLNEKEWSKEMSKEFYNSTEVIDLRNKEKSNEHVLFFRIKKLIKYILTTSLKLIEKYDLIKKKKIW